MGEILCNSPKPNVIVNINITRAIPRNPAQNHPTLPPLGLQQKLAVVACFHSAGTLLILLCAGIEIPYCNTFSHAACEQAQHCAAFSLFDFGDVFQHTFSNQHQKQHRKRLKQSLLRTLIKNIF